jgi:hypothetical protein
MRFGRRLTHRTRSAIYPLPRLAGPRAQQVAFFRKPARRTPACGAVLQGRPRRYGAPRLQHEPEMSSFGGMDLTAPLNKSPSCRAATSNPLAVERRNEDVSARARAVLYCIWMGTQTGLDEVFSGRVLTSESDELKLSSIDRAVVAAALSRRTS